MRTYFEILREYLLDAVNVALLIVGFGIGAVFPVLLVSRGVVQTPLGKVLALAISIGTVVVTILCIIARGAYEEQKEKPTKEQYYF